MGAITLLQLVGGLLALIFGGDLLIRGSSKIAASLGISSLVIGLTIVAFGTSAPELVVSLQSTFSGFDSMAVANVVGSNIFNVLLILGACAVTAPLVVNSQLVRLDVPLMLASAILLMVFSYNGVIARWEGLILVILLAGYTTFLIRKSRKESREVQAQYDQEYAGEKLAARSLLINLFFVAAGIGLLVLGGDWLVTSAVEIASAMGVSETVIGLTIVAAGTSLPEVATSVIATFKGERDIAIGNVVGSNIFNILLILGLSSTVSGHGLVVSEELMSTDLPVMLATFTACLPIFIAGFIITRWDGALFLLCYAVYLAFTVLKSTQHELLPQFQTIIIYFIVPVITLALVGSLAKALKTFKEHR